MHVLLALALILSLMFLAVLGVSNIERELIGQPSRPMDHDDEHADL